MPDLREVAENARGKTSWSVAEVHAAIPSMDRARVEATLRAHWGTSALACVGPTGWHGGPDMKASHWFVRGWAICGWGTIAAEHGRNDAGECPVCRNEVERTKVA